MMMYNNNPYFNNSTFQPMQPNQMVQQPNFGMMQPVQQQPIMMPPTPRETNITSGGFSFTVVKDDNHTPRPTDIMVDNDGSPVEEPKKRRGRPRKEATTVIGAAAAKEDKSSSDMPTMYTYQETTDMLRGAMMQIDQLSGQVKGELDTVMGSKTLRNKYSIVTNLSENLTGLISAKITAIKEINNAISKSNDMDYKKEKDRKAAEAGINDDKYLMDLYNAFIQNPGNIPGGARSVLGPTGLDATLGANDIIRASTQPQQPGFNPDTGYLSYVTNMTPEQRLMAMEDNPNIKMCVVFDAASGNKSFQMMDMTTGQAIPGLPVRDPMFMEDTTIDLRNNIAKNINLNETYPLVVINQQVAKEY